MSNIQHLSHLRFNANFAFSLKDRGTPSLIWVRRYCEKTTKIVNASFTRHTTKCQYFLMTFAVDELQTVLYKAEKLRQDQI